MMYLWGTNRASKWLSKDVRTRIEATGLPMKPDAAARMLWFHASFLSTVENYKRLGVDRVEVLGTSDSCEDCQKLQKRRYRLDRVPELPYARCTHVMGCRCSMIAKFA